MSKKPDSCYESAMPDEPLFVLLARDPDAPALVEAWVRMRAARITLGEAPLSDAEKVEEAEALAASMRAWRQSNDGAWRRQNPELPFEDATQRRAAIYNGEV